MAKKFLSLIIIPHTKTHSRTLSFSKRAIKIMMWSAIIVGVLILAVSADYVRIRMTRQSYNSLLAENRLQKDTLKQYEGSIGALEDKVKGFEDYVRKLNLFAGIKSPDKLLNPGVGDPRESQVVPSAPPRLSTDNLQNIQQKTEDIKKNFDTLVNFFENQAAQLASTPSIWPTIGWPSSGFGIRLDPFTRKQAFHSGLDIAAAYGNPVVVTADGFVAKVNVDKMFGNSIAVAHGGGVATFYGHLSSILVKPGQKVKRGDEIGKVGNSGRSIGTHLHYEVRINDKPVNPWTYILED